MQRLAKRFPPRMEIMFQHDVSRFVSRYLLHQIQNPICLARICSAFVLNAGFLLSRRYFFRHIYNFLSQFRGLL